MENSTNSFHGKEQILNKSCKLIVQLVRNHVEERRGGLHTRIFSHILNPEADYVCAGVSREAAEVPRSKWYLEHVVPCRTLVVELRRLVIQNSMSDDRIAALLRKHWKVAWITKDQAREIDKHYKSDMPRGWNFESGDTLVRLSGIELLPYQTRPVIPFDISTV